MEYRVALGEWRPDLPPLVNRGLTVAKGVLPVGAGYKPFPSWVSLGLGALTGFARGHVATQDTGGVNYNFAGDATKLYRIGPQGLQDVTRTAGAYNASGSAQWEFMRFRNTVIALNPNDDMQTFDMAEVGGMFEQLSAQAPRARRIGFIGPQLIVGDLFDPQLGSLPDGFRYPALGNPSSWPDPEDPDAALPVQAGRTVIEGDGGRIQAIVSGSEVGAVFQERQVSRVEYVGGDVIYQVDRVEKTRGLLVPRLAIPFGRVILYLSEDGWYLFDYTESRKVGDEKVDRTFLADIDPSYFHRASAVAHPDQPVIAIGYAGAGNSSGTPNKVIFYNWAQNKWAGPTDQQHELLVRVVPVGLTLDSLPDESLDSISESFDDAVGTTGAQQFGAYDTTHTLGTFSGTAQAAVLETGDQEHQPGRVTRVRSVRPLVDGAEPTVQVAARFDRAATVSFGPAVQLNRAGEAPVRAKGRYHRYRVNIPAGGFDEAVALDIEGQPAGKR